MTELFHIDETEDFVYEFLHDGFHFAGYSKGEVNNIMSSFEFDFDYTKGVTVLKYYGAGYGPTRSQDTFYELLEKLSNNGINVEQDLRY